LTHVQTTVPCRLDGRTSTARNFHIKASRVWTRRMVVRMVDLMHAISISDTRVRTMRTIVRTYGFECDTCLMDESVQTGIHVVRTVAAIFPYLCFGKKY
jgi:hypothetical protein